jgi:hypothetical protein
MVATVALVLSELELVIEAELIIGRVVETPCKLELEIEVELRASRVVLVPSEVELEYE